MEIILYPCIAMALMSVAAAVAGIYSICKRRNNILIELDNGLFPDVECTSDVEEVLNTAIRKHGFPHTVVRSTETGLTIELYWNRKHARE